MEKFTNSRLAAKILDILEKGDKSIFTIQERTKDLVRETVIEPTLSELESEGLAKETERLPGQKVWQITEKGKKLVEGEKAKAEQTKRLLKED